MKALRIDDYGGRENLQIVDMDRPEVRPGDALIEVHAASVNPVDWKIREGYMKAFMDIPMPHVLGRDVSGVVIALGDDATGLSVGDAARTPNTPPSTPVCSRGNPSGPITSKRRRSRSPRFRPIPDS
jgi:NADPH:quinone reductase-like Zn-dependent oxidoreductase